MKRKIFLPIILSALMLTACGSSDSPSFSESKSSNFAASSNAGGAAYDSAEMNYGYDNSYSGDENYEQADAEVSDASSASPEKTNNTSVNVIRKEMLVYSCNMSIDVLDFSGAMTAFKNSLDSYGAFVETENYSDGGSGGHWYYSDSDREKWQSYSATIRVPSDKYDDFCSQTSQLGYLRSKSANVQNMSSEYYDLSDTLAIYEAKEKRYMDLLKTITDEEYAIQVERELTDIQIEISKLRTRMNKIQTDVAYSYIYITVNEVKEYIAEPEKPDKPDNFFTRMGKEIKESAEDFLDVMEGLLIVFIHLFPHLVVLGIIAFIIVKAVKSANKRKAEKMAAAAPNRQNPAYTAYTYSNAGNNPAPANPSQPVQPTPAQSAPAAPAQSAPANTAPAQSDASKLDAPERPAPAEVKDKKDNKKK